MKLGLFIDKTKNFFSSLTLERVEARRPSASRDSK